MPLRHSFHGRCPYLRRSALSASSASRASAFAAVCMAASRPFPLAKAFASAELALCACCLVSPSISASDRPPLSWEPLQWLAHVLRVEKIRALSDPALPETVQEQWETGSSKGHDNTPRYPASSGHPGPAQPLQLPVFLHKVFSCLLHKGVLARARSPFTGVLRSVQLTRCLPCFRCCRYCLLSFLGQCLLQQYHSYLLHLAHVGLLSPVLHKSVPAQLLPQHRIPRALP